MALYLILETLPTPAGNVIFNAPLAGTMPAFFNFFVIRKKLIKGNIKNCRIINAELITVTRKSQFIWRGFLHHPLNLPGDKKV